MDVVEVGIVHGGLPSFRSRYGGETLRAAITHYNGNRLGQVTMSVESCVSCPKGVPGPAYIGGQTQGYKVVTYPARLQSPKPIRQAYRLPPMS